tara:strand:+ start:3147 stop:3572 length:426 start_codon:yes stop_codon:yes gene_type:complete
MNRYTARPAVVQSRITLPMRVTASLLAAVFGLQWILLHLVALGISILSPDFSKADSPSSSFGLMESHKDCQVCIVLKEQNQNDDGSPSNISVELVKIEAISRRGDAFLGVKNLHVAYILDPDSFNAPPYPFSSKKPPKYAA